MLILPKASHKFNAMPIKILEKFFTELKRAIFKFIWKKKKAQITKTILYNRRTSRGIILSDFKLYYTAAVMKSTLYCQRKRQGDEWNRIEDLDINPHTYKHLIFDKEAKI